MRGERKLLITVLATIALTILLTVALVALRLHVQQERQSSVTQTKVPALEGLSYGDAESLLRCTIQLFKRNCLV